MKLEQVKIKNENAAYNQWKGLSRNHSITGLRREDGTIHWTRHARGRKWNVQFFLSRAAVNSNHAGARCRVVADFNAVQSSVRMDGKIKQYARRAVSPQ